MNFDYCPKCGHQGSVQKQDETNYECQNCKWHFWNNAKAATTLIFLKDDLILLGKRAIEPRLGMYDFPGGFVDFGETAYSGAIREAKEELGVTIAPEDLELIEVYHNEYGPGCFTIDIIFIVRAWTGELTAASEISELAWKPLSFVNDPQFAQKFYIGLDKILAAKSHNQHR